MCERHDHAMALSKRALDDSDKVMPVLRSKTQGCAAPTREEAEAVVARLRNGVERIAKVNGADNHNGNHQGDGFFSRLTRRLRG